MTCLIKSHPAACICESCLRHRTCGCGRPPSVHVHEPDARECSVLCAIHLKALRELNRERFTAAYISKLDPGKAVA